MNDIEKRSELALEKVSEKTETRESDNSFFWTTNNANEPKEEDETTWQYK